MRKIIYILMMCLLVSCNSGDKAVEEYNIKNGIQKPESASGVEGRDAYEVMSVVFEGRPDKEEIQPMLEDVMKRYGMPVTNDNLLKAGNMFVTLKNSSKVGVTEMEILKRVYQKGNSTEDFPTNAARASVYLEANK